MYEHMYMNGYEYYMYMNGYMYMYKSLHCSPKTITTSLIGY